MINLNSKRQNCKNNGFTLIELLVVIAIIGVLSSVVLASVNEAREKAKTVRILRDFKTIEKAFYLLADDKGINKWWKETDFGQGHNPYISELVNNTDLGKFLSVAPESPTGTGAHYEYDNDGDTFVCGGSPTYKGANLFLRSVDEKYFFRLDNTVDGGDGSACGTITAHGSGSDTVIGFNMANKSDEY